MSSTPHLAVDTSWTAGRLIRHWRQARQQTQQDLAGVAEVSPRHLSCLESGKAQPSRAMLLRLSRHLEIPLRDTNRLLMAAGYSPQFVERPWTDPSLSTAMDVVHSVLRASEPSPAFTVDRHWNLLARNRMTDALLAGVAPDLLEPPVNVFRLVLHPRGLAPQVLNLAEWRDYVFGRLNRQIRATADPWLVGLLHELERLPAADLPSPADPFESPVVALPMRLRSPWGELALINTVTVFGTAVDLALSELSMEVLYPADTATREALESIWKGLP